jgi:hypothetical protein
MKNLVYLIAFLLFVSCTKEQSATYKEMNSDASMSEFFTDNELENLAKIVDFFESQICSDKNLSKEECYSNFDQDIFNKAFKDYKINKNEFMIIPINYKLQKKLYKKIDTYFLKEIWINPVIGYSLKEKLMKRDWYALNLFGKYSKFIKKTGEENNDLFFKNIYENFNLTNELSVAQTLIETKKISINDYKDIKKNCFSQFII